MAKKASERIGQGIGLIIGLALVAATMAVALLPLYLLGALVKNALISRKLRKNFPDGGQVAWLTEAERQRFKQIHPDLIVLREFVNVATERSERPGLSRNKDGSLDLRNTENKKLTHELYEARQLLERLEIEFENLEHKTFLQWHEFNDTLKKSSRMWMTLLGWLIGAAFLYSKIKAGAPINIWIDVFILALCAGTGVLFAMAFSRYPASIYSPMPACVDMDNVDSPAILRPLQKRSKLLQFTGAFVWSTFMITAAQKGKEYGTSEAIDQRERSEQQQTETAEFERRIREGGDMTPLIPSTDTSVGAIPDGDPASGDKRSDLENIRNRVHREHIQSRLLASLNVGDVENLILAIYARYGAEFESPSAQKWANQQSWYRKVSGKTINDAEKEFDPIAVNNVNRLVARWNEIQVEEGHAPLPVEESPLAGRGMSDDREENLNPAPARVLSALPVDDVPEVSRGNLNPEEVSKWSFERVRYEINTIYARHGVVFPKREIQAYFETKDWYRPVPGLSFAEAESRFSPAEKLDIELLSSRREEISNNQ